MLKHASIFLISIQFGNLTMKKQRKFIVRINDLIMKALKKEETLLMFGKYVG